MAICLTSYTEYNLQPLHVKIPARGFGSISLISVFSVISVLLLSILKVNVLG